MRRAAQRAADVGAEFERHIPGRQRRSAAARRAARAAPEIPRVVRRAVDVIVALPVGETDRHVGFADDHRTGCLQPLDRQRVGGRTPVAAFRISPGRRQAGDIELLLDRHRDTEQRPTRGVAAAQFQVGCRGRVARPLEIAHDNRVDLRVERLDT